MSAEPSHGSEACARCGRPLGARGCFYCGLALGDEPARRAKFQERTHARGATLMRFVVSSAVLVPLGLAFLRSGLDNDDALAFALAASAFVLGPITLVVQLFRRLSGPVRVREDELVLGGDRKVRWAQLRDVTHVVSLAARLPSVPVIGSFLSGLPRTSDVIRHWNHRNMGFAIALSGAVGLLLAPLFATGYFFVPAVLLLLPWHDRVVLLRERGDPIVLHDLEAASTFVVEARERAERARGGDHYRAAG